jgi:hypothetical protein
MRVYALMIQGVLWWRVFWYIKDEESNMLNSIFPTKRTYGTTPFHFLAPSKTKNETES